MHLGTDRELEQQAAAVGREVASSARLRRESLAALAIDQRERGAAADQETLAVREPRQPVGGTRWRTDRGRGTAGHGPQQDLVATVRVADVGENAAVG